MHNHTSIRTNNPHTQTPQPFTTTTTTTDPAAAIRLDSSSSAMAATALIFILILLFLCLFSVFARRFFTEIHGADISHRRPPPPLPRHRYIMPSAGAAGLDPSTVRALPLLTYAGGGVKEVAGCVVCLCEFEEKERVKVIPGCGHVFHPGCIDAWLVSHGSCPICRCSEVLGVVGGEVCVDVGESVNGGGEEEGIGLEVAVVGERGWEEEKIVGLGRSRSCSSCSVGEGERRVFLRRTCSM